MKRLGIILIICTMAFFVKGQYAANTLAASVPGTDRMSVIRNSIDLAAWHETSFWPLYETYMSKVETVSYNTYSSLTELSQMNSEVSDEKALALTKNLIKNRYEELEVRKQYFNQIASELNGRVGFQFLQTEIMLDMMESSKIYDKSAWVKYKVHPLVWFAEGNEEGRKNFTLRALKVSDEQKEQFLAVYQKYVEDTDALLGEDHFIISLYAGEASDYTPALARRLGNDFINLIEREIKLEEKYFNEMQKAVGASLATRFFALQDYHSLIFKMYAWADAP